MKNIFAIIVKYTASLDEIDANLADHRAYLKKGYDAGFLIASGPQTPKTGGLILGVFENIEAARNFTANDPFLLRGVAESCVIEMNPVLHCEEIKAKLQ